MAQRRQSRTAEIVAAAWELARVNGIGGLSLHALAREVGIRQPSLYAYFDSKNALYDAMFADGNRRLAERLDSLEFPTDSRAAVKVFMREFIDFALDDTARCALLFQRPIPGFEPSVASYEVAQDVLARVVDLLQAAGVESQDDIDCFVAMVGGLVDAQMSNDPGGDRWTRHLDRLVDMYLDEFTTATNTPNTTKTSKKPISPKNVTRGGRADERNSYCPTRSANDRRGGVRALRCARCRALRRGVDATDRL